MIRRACPSRMQKSAHDASKQVSSTPKERTGANEEVWRKGREMMEHDRNRVYVCHALDSVVSEVCWSWQHAIVLKLSYRM